MKNVEKSKMIQYVKETKTPQSSTFGAYRFGAKNNIVDEKL